MKLKTKCYVDDSVIVITWSVAVTNMLMTLKYVCPIEYGILDKVNTKRNNLEEIVNWNLLKV